MRSRLILCSLALALSTAQAQSTPTYVQLILDASGSMYGKLESGETRISVAKDVLSSFIARLPADPGLNVGLRIYGSLVPTGEGACLDSKLFMPMKGLDRAALQAQVTGTKPRGATPIAYSLEQAALDFPQDQSRKLIVLVTDGQESCRGNLAGTLELFKKRGIEVDLRIVGIDLDARAQASFQGVGTFENARSSAELASALGRAVEQVARPSEATLPVSVTLTSGGKPLPQGAKVSFSSTLDDKSRSEFSAANGGYSASLKAGTYTARIETAESGVQSFAGLTVAPGLQNRFVFEVGKVAEVRLEVSPTQPTAGGKVRISFSGAPAGEKNWVALAQKTDRDSAYLDYQNVRGASGTLELSVPEEEIEYEARYLLVSPDGSSRVVGRSAAFTPRKVAASLEAPAEAAAGGTVQVKWSGPNNDRDYVTVVKAGAPEGAYTDYKYTRQGNPLELRLPSEGGAFELRYASDNTNRTLASRPITLKLSQYALETVKEALGGAEISVRWTGPNNPRDYITVVKKGAPVGSYLDYAYTREGNPVQLKLPFEAGEYEIRYSSEGQSPNPTLASAPITLSRASYALEAPRTAKPGETVQIRWSGPGGSREYVTVVKKGAPVGSYTTYFYVRSGNPGSLRMPDAPGEYEIRYSTEAQSPNPTLFSLPITVK